MQPSRRRLLLLCGIVAASVCLALGLSLPFLRLGEGPILGFAGEEQSLIAVVSALLRSGQFLLGGTLLVLALLIPILRLLYLVLLAAIPLKDITRSGDTLRTVAWLGRWSAHDILGLAVATLTVTAQQPIERIGNGAYLFVAAMLAMMLAASWLHRDIGASHLRLSAETAAISAAARGRAFAILVVAATSALVFGLLLPVVRLTRAYGGADQHSIASLLPALHDAGEIALCTAILAGAAVLPALRLLHLWALIACRSLPAGAFRTGMVAITGTLGPYGIVDTLALTLALVYVIATGLVAPALEWGTSALIASAALTLAASAWGNSAPSRPRKLTERLGALREAETA
ncbi:MAG TPA: paraquat-inducible protein A [Hyphomicrobiaceae bacterium]|nr:paraquat-inducible protein A [Hyphomicrobiaceae bacterium]